MFPALHKAGPERSSPGIRGPLIPSLVKINDALWRLTVEDTNDDACMYTHPLPSSSTGEQYGIMPLVSHSSNVPGRATRQVFEGSREPSILLPPFSRPKEYASRRLPGGGEVGFQVSSCENLRLHLKIVLERCYSPWPWPDYVLAAVIFSFLLDILSSHT